MRFSQLRFPETTIGPGGILTGDAWPFRTTKLSGILSGVWKRQDKHVRLLIARSSTASPLFPGPRMESVNRGKPISEHEIEAEMAIAQTPAVGTIPIAGHPSCQRFCIGLSWTIWKSFEPFTHVTP